MKTSISLILVSAFQQDNRCIVHLFNFYTIDPLLLELTVAELERTVKRQQEQLDKLVERIENLEKSHHCEPTLTKSCELEWHHLSPINISLLMSHINNLTNRTYHHRQSIPSKVHTHNPYPPGCTQVQHNYIQARRSLLAS